MAKSIYDILDDLTTETSVPGFGMVTHSLPRHLLPTAEIFENRQSLLEWAEDNGFTHAILQKGIQKFLIDLRAIFKAVKKDNVWKQSKGQNNVTTAEWNVVKRPKVNDKEKIESLAIFKANLNIAKAMQASGVMNDEMILATLTDSCGKEIAIEIMAELDKA